MNKRIPIDKLFYFNSNRQRCQHDSININIFIQDEKLPQRINGTHMYHAVISINLAL